MLFKMMLGLSFAKSKQAVCYFMRFAASAKSRLRCHLVVVDPVAAVFNWTVDAVSTFWKLIGGRAQDHVGLRFFAGSIERGVAK
jgi:hypothetical protein